MTVTDTTDIILRLCEHTAAGKTLLKKAFTHLAQATALQAALVGVFSFQVTQDIPLYNPLFIQLKLCQAF